MRSKIFLYALFSALFILIFGCKKDSPIEPSISNELFPLTVGNKLEYTEYEIDQNNTKVANTDLRVVRTILSQTTVKGVSAYMVIDESYKGTALDSKDTSFISKDANGDVKYYIAINQNIMEGVSFNIGDWFYFYKPSEGAGKTYTVFKKDTTMQITQLGVTLPATISLNVTGKINNKENITVPYQTGAISATPVEINMKVTATVSLPPLPPTELYKVEGKFFTQWLAEGIGPIKEESPVFLGSKGYRRELSKKYF